MLQLISSNLSTILIGAVVLLVLVLVIVYLRKNKNSCDSCAGCPSSGHCHPEDKCQQ